MLAHSVADGVPLGAARIALSALLLQSGDAQGAADSALGGLTWLRSRQASPVIPVLQCRTA